MGALEDQVRRDFAPLADDVMGIFLFGSQATGRAHATSDVDVCIVAGPNQTIEETLRRVWSSANVGAARYDVRVFEELPLYLKGAVIDEGILVLARDEPQLSEYLRPTRKVWSGMRHRAVMSAEDARRMMDARRRARS